MSNVPVLETDRLRLRPLIDADAEALHPSFADVDLMHWWSRPPHETVEETRADLARVSPDWRRWIITLRDSDTAIGFVAVGEKRQGEVMELGYILARAHWGRGVAHEAVARVIDHLFAEGNRRIFADTDPENAGSNALLERLGFTLEGRLRGEWETHIGVRDSFIWGLLADEWKAR